MKRKIRDWSLRYIPAEIVALFTALLGAYLGLILTGDYIISAFSGIIGENIGYYAK